MELSKNKLRIIITFAVLFLVVSILLLLVFFAGKKTYTVRFELNGGTLISGSLEQHVIQGQNATLPSVTKEGAYLHSWSKSHQRITKDTVIEAVWEYSTTPGIIYASSSNQNFTEIAGTYDYLRGEVYVGAYFSEKKTLGIRAGAFADRTAVTGIYLLNGLIYIGDNAFTNCSALRSIEIPKTVTNLGSEVFLGCEALEAVTLHTGLLEMGEGAFTDCTALKEVTLPKTLTVLSANTFYGCTSLERVVLPEGLTEIGSSAFEGCVALKEIVIPSTVTKIGENAFKGCEALEEVILNEGLTEIGASAFRNCAALKEIVLPATAQTIGSFAFSGCTAMEAILLNEGLLTVGSSAFSGCESLKVIVIPESVENIYSNAFRGCDNLTVTVAGPLDEEKFDGWARQWWGSARVIWPGEYTPPITLPILRPERPFPDPDVIIGGKTDIEPEPAPVTPPESETSPILDDFDDYVEEDPEPDGTMEWDVDGDGGEAQTESDTDTEDTLIPIDIQIRPIRRQTVLQSLS